MALLFPQGAILSPWVLGYPGPPWHRVVLTVETIPAPTEIPQSDGSCQGWEKAQAGCKPDVASAGAREEQREGAATGKPALAVV